MRFQACLCALLVAVILVGRSDCEERLSATEQSAAAKSAPDDRPLSVFDERVRRFRFELEDMLVAAETAEGFLVLHRPRNEPAIIGAYADAETNTLVVIGPPEAEHSIRETLATWMVERAGIEGPPPLAAQRMALKFRREELLCEMAALEVQLVAEAAERAEQIKARLNAFNEELSVVEKQIQIVDRYLERLERRIDAS